jgi:hypothetical protein
MKTPEHKYLDVKPGTRPGDEHDGLEELGLLVLILGNSIMLGFIALAVYVTYLLIS